MKREKLSWSTTDLRRWEWISPPECPTASLFKFIKCSDEDPIFRYLGRQTEPKSRVGYGTWVRRENTGVVNDLVLERRPAWTISR